MCTTARRHQQTVGSDERILPVTQSSCSKVSQGGCSKVSQGGEWCAHRLGRDSAVLYISSVDDGDGFQGITKTPYCCQVDLCGCWEFYLSRRVVCCPYSLHAAPHRVLARVVARDVRSGLVASPRSSAVRC